MFTFAKNVTEYVMQYSKIKNPDLVLKHQQNKIIYCQLISTNVYHMAMQGKHKA